MIVNKEVRLFADRDPEKEPLFGDRGKSVPKPDQAFRHEMKNINLAHTT
jgi:hypothetical protein